MLDIVWFHCIWLIALYLLDVTDAKLKYTADIFINAVEKSAITATGIKIASKVVRTIRVFIFRFLELLFLFFFILFLATLLLIQSSSFAVLYFFALADDF